MINNQDKKTILRIKVAYHKFVSRLSILRSRECEVLKEYKEEDRQQKILDIKKELEK